MGCVCVSEDTNKNQFWGLPMSMVECAHAGVVLCVCRALNTTPSSSSCSPAWPGEGPCRYLPSALCSCLHHETGIMCIAHMHVVLWCCVVLWSHCMVNLLQAFFACSTPVLHLGCAQIHGAFVIWCPDSALPLLPVIQLGSCGSQ